MTRGVHVKQALFLGGGGWWAWCTCRESVAVAEKHARILLQTSVGAEGDEATIRVPSFGRYIGPGRARNPIAHCTTRIYYTLNGTWITALIRRDLYHEWTEGGKQLTKQVRSKAMDVMRVVDKVVAETAVAPSVEAIQLQDYGRSNQLT